MSTISGVGGLQSVYTAVQTQSIQQQSRAQAVADEAFSSSGGGSSAAKAAGTDRDSTRGVNLVA